MPDIYMHTDTDGDRLTVTSNSTDNVYIAVNRSPQVRLAPKQVADLRQALAPHDPTTRPVVPVVGGEYRVLPDARNSGGRSALVNEGVTRVRVNRDVDRDGDYRVTALDGTATGYDGYYVKPEYLAPIEEPKPVEPVTPADVIDEVRVAAVEKALETLGKSVFVEEVTADDVVTIAAYIAGEYDVINDEEVDA